MANDSTWPEKVRRSALLLISVACRDSSHAAQHLLQLEVQLLLCFRAIHESI